MGEGGEAVRFEATILRKQDDLPRYVEVPQEVVPGRKGSFVAEVWLNDMGPFERNVHPWGKGREVFFFNLTAGQCTKAGVETGETCLVTVMVKD